MILSAPRLTGGPHVMGILNVTPDSFSDGALFLRPEAAVRHGLRLLEEGADLLDIGGESTRPGAAPVSEQEELDRVLPVIEALCARTEAVISIDTMKPSVARAAIASGARIWNDVTGLRAPGALEAALALQAPVIVMHMQGEPRTMQAEPRYGDVVDEVVAFLKGQVDALARGGLQSVWVDPGIGFGKTAAHNLALIQALGRIRAQTGRPLAFGASRKSIIARIDPTAVGAHDRIGGSLALALAGARGGADMIRVHDVRETVQALKVQAALEATR